MANRMVDMMVGTIVFTNSLITYHHLLLWAPPFLHHRVFPTATWSRPWSHAGPWRSGRFSQIAWWEIKGWPWPVSWLSDVVSGDYNVIIWFYMVIVCYCNFWIVVTNSYQVKFIEILGNILCSSICFILRIPILYGCGIIVVDLAWYGYPMVFLMFG